MIEFRGDDCGYKDWLAGNLEGFVVNTTRPPSAKYLVLHVASCPHITQLKEKRVAKTWTEGEYMKTCSTDIRELESWAAGIGGELIRKCRCLRPGGTHK